MKSAPAIGFSYRTSRWLLAGTPGIAVLAIVAVSISGSPAWLRWGSIVFIAAYAGAAFGRALRPRIRSLLWLADGGIEIRLRDSMRDSGRSVHGELLGARVMGPLIVLTLRWPLRERAHLWLLPDNLDVDTRRRLRMRLGAGPGAAPASGNADSR
ncbi:MAG TPA: hypothetical protein VFY97_06155 [Rhodanobacteraceae bacterium]|nr:hypothetical protein [Rhodanobacteraceae bacterium]